MVIICIKLEDHTELRHVAKLLHRIIGKGSAYSSVSVNLVSKSALCRRGCRKEIGVGYFYRMFLLFHLGFISQSVGCASVFLVVYIHAGNFPLCVAHCHQISTVIVCWRTPEVRLRNCLDHFFTCVFIGYQSAVEYGEKYFKLCTSDTDVVDAVNDLKRCCAWLHRCFYFVYVLAEGYLVTSLCPWLILFQMEGYGYGILACFFLFLKWKGIFFLA